MRGAAFGSTTASAAATWARFGTYSRWPAGRFLSSTGSARAVRSRMPGHPGLDHDCTSATAIRRHGISRGCRVLDDQQGLFTAVRSLVAATDDLGPSQVAGLADLHRR